MLSLIGSYIPLLRSAIQFCLLGYRSAALAALDVRSRALNDLSLLDRDVSHIVRRTFEQNINLFECEAPGLRYAEVDENDA
jgi:hypothetical protein